MLLLLHIDRNSASQYNMPEVALHQRDVFSYQECRGQQVNGDLLTEGPVYRTVSTRAYITEDVQAEKKDIHGVAEGFFVTLAPSANI